MIGIIACQHRARLDDRLPSTARWHDGVAAVMATPNPGVDVSEPNVQFEKEGGG